MLGHAYLVPFWNNTNKYFEVQFIPGYRGLMELARRSNAVRKITAHVVYDADVFEFEYGADEKLIHKPELRKDRGGFHCAYAVATLDDGYTIIEVVPMGDIEKIKQTSLSKIKKEEAKNYSPWVTSFDEMARKTAVRRIFKYLPISLDKHEKLAEAIKFDNQRDDDPFFGVEVIDAPIKDVAPIPPPSEGKAELEQMNDEEIEKLIEVAKDRIKNCKDVGKISALDQKFKVRGLDDLYNLDGKQLSDLIAFIG